MMFMVLVQTSGSSIFMESNYFDAVKRPIMSSLQGTDAMGDGTFSGEKGGLILRHTAMYLQQASKLQLYPIRRKQYKL